MKTDSYIINIFSAVLGVLLGALLTLLLKDKFDISIYGLAIVITLLLFICFLLIIKELKEIKQAIQPEGYTFHKKWNDALVMDAIRNVKNGSTINIIRTWFNDSDKYAPCLEEVLSTKELKLCILIFNHKAADLLNSRIVGRESEDVLIHIKSTIDRLKLMKTNVEKKCNGKKLDIKIYKYKFLQFGPFYQIGKDKLFIGLYPSIGSHEIMPMLAIESNSNYWELFFKNFDDGLNHAEEIKDLDKELNEIKEAIKMRAIENKK